MLLGEGNDGGVGQDVPAAEGAPCLSGYAQLSVQCSKPGLLQPRVQLDLVYRRDNFGLLHQLLKVSGLEIGNPNSPHFAFTVERLHGLVRFGKQAPAVALPAIEGLTDETAGDDYLSLMRDNLAALQEANGC